MRHPRDIGVLRGVLPLGLAAALSLGWTLAEPADPEQESEVPPGTAIANRGDLSAAAAAADGRGAPLAKRHRAWLEEVDILLTEEERNYFLSLREDFRRDAFIEQFWKVRDPEPATVTNELKRNWKERVGTALSDWGTLRDDRARAFLLNGPPGPFRLPDGRQLSVCYHKTKEMEIWFYEGSDRTIKPHMLIFQQDEFKADTPYRVWKADTALRPASRRQLPTTDIALLCAEELLPWVMGFINEWYGDRYGFFVDDLLRATPLGASEWVETFAAQTTDLPPGAETFDIDLQVDFPGRNQLRTAVQGLVTVDPRVVDAEGARGRQTHHFLLTGEVVRNDRLLEQFRYEFEIPAGEGPIPLIFQRYVRPGPARILLKIEDLLGRRFAHADHVIKVPSPEGLASVRKAPEGEVFRLLAEANIAAANGQRTLQLMPPPEGEVQIGLVRFHALAVGDFERVEFQLDGKPLMAKRSPPYSVELDLGSAASAHRLGVVGYDEDGRVLARDEISVNQGGQRFRVRLSEPRTGGTYRDSLSAVATVEVPDGQKLDRLEIFLDEQRIATLYQEPFVQPILLEHDGLAYVRAVGYLQDGNSSETTVFFNTPEYFEQVDVQMVELHATVLGAGGRPITDLEQHDFRVLEDGVAQEIRRFQYVRDLPIHAGLLIDTSASMRDSLPFVTRAARRFVEETIAPKDRFTLLSFNYQPQVEIKFTSEVDRVSEALRTLRATSTTALYDSLIYALHYFDGIRGPRALLVLSDGEDEASHFDLESTLQVAQRAGVTIYVIGLREAARDRAARKILKRFADETGGQAFFIQNLEELPAIYQQIQDDLRSQYLIAYQSSSQKDKSQFRRIKVEVKGRGAEVRTLSGYYP